MANYEKWSSSKGEQILRKKFEADIGESTKRCVKRRSPRDHLPTYADINAVTYSPNALYDYVENYVRIDISPDAYRKLVYLLERIYESPMPDRFENRDHTKSHAENYFEESIQELHEELAKIKEEKDIAEQDPRLKRAWEKYQTLKDLILSGKKSR